MFEDTKYNLVALGEIVAPKEIRNPWHTPDRSFNYIDITSVSNKQFAIVDSKKYMGKDAPSRARKVVRTGDVIFATTRPYLRSVARVSPELNEQVCSTGFCILRPTDRITSEWLFYCAISDDVLNQITPKMRGANYPAVTDKDVLAAVVPLPPIGEQHRIIARIKECMERIEEIEQLRNEGLSEADCLAPSLCAAIEDSREWPLVPVEKMIVRSRNGRSITQDNKNANGYVLSLRAVHDVILNTEHRKPIVLEDEVAQQFSITAGDIFVSRSNTSDLVGLASVATVTPSERLIYPDLMIKLEVDTSIVLPRFLVYALRTPNCRTQIKARAVGTSQSMVKISGQRLKEVKVPLPRLDAQEELINQFDMLHDISANIVSTMRSISVDTLRQSILRKAFAGEL